MARQEGTRQTAPPLLGCTLRMKTAPQGHEESSLELGQIFARRDYKLHPFPAPRALCARCAAASPAGVRGQARGQTRSRAARAALGETRAPRSFPEMRKKPCEKLQLPRRLMASDCRDAVLRPVTRTATSGERTCGARAGGRTISGTCPSKPFARPRAACSSFSPSLLLGIPVVSDTSDIIR